MKKALVLVLLAALCVSLFAGCAGNNGSTATTSAATAATTAAAKTTAATTTAGAATTAAAGTTAVITYEPMTFTTFTTSQEAAANRDIDLFASALLEKFNVTLETEYIAQSSLAETMQLRYVSDEHPDVEFNTFADLDKYGVEGYYVPFDDYFDKMPNMRAVWPDDFWQDYLELTEQSDGKHYSLRVPVGNVQLVGEGILYRMSTIKELGVEVPKTTDEFYTYLTAIKNKYPDSIPFSNRNGFGGAIARFNDAFRTSLGFQYDMDYSAFTYEPTTDKYRDMLTYVARLFKDGLMSPEFATQSVQQWSEQVGAGKVHVLCEYFAREGWANNLCAEVDPEANWTSSHEFLNAYPDKPLMVSRYTSVGGSSARIASRNTGDRLDRLIEILDWLCTEEGSIRTQMGVEGVTYTINGNNEMEYMPHLITPLNPDKGTETLLKYNLECRMFYCPRFFYYQGGGVSTIIGKEVFDNDYDYFKSYSLNLTEDEQTTAADFGTVVDDTMQQYSLKFIMGQLDPTDDTAWNDYVQTIGKIGLEKLLVIYQTAYTEKYGN